MTETKTGHHDVETSGLANPSFTISSEDVTSTLPVEPQQTARNSKSCDTRRNKNLEPKKIESITYTWKNINCWIGSLSEIENRDVERGGGDTPETSNGKSKVVSKRILTNVSGSVRPGELVAMMGASGAGKTTLLNLMTFRNPGKLKASGDFTVNGVVITGDMLTSLSAYVQQDDLFIGALTVREHLIFQALVRMHSHIPYKQRMERVEEVIQELGLTKCSNTMIGIPGNVKGISGGEMKRLAFASEVLTDPPLMFCDEPTSGLDSFMAENVITVLKEMAKKSKTIICTIHQPSSEVYEMFDRILLLSEGRTAFLGNPKAALTFFSDQGFPCPNNYNPSDFFIQTLAIQPGDEEHCRSKVKTICDGFDTKVKEDAGEIAASSGGHRSSLSGDFANFEKRTPYKASWWAQFRAVLWRSWLSVIKNPVVLKIRVIQTVAIALLTGVVYFGQDLDQKGIMNINGAFFLILMNMTFQNIFAVINVFCVELPVFLREHFNGMYRVDVYFISKMLAELGIFVMAPIVFISICYFMVGFNSAAEKFLIATIVCILVANVSCSFGYLLGTISPNAQIALAMAPAYIIPFMLFGGFFLNKASIPVYLVWLKYFSWFMYSNELIIVNNWEGINEIECEYPSERNSSCILDGAAVLRNQSYTSDNTVTNYVALVALLVGYRFLAFLALLWKTKRKN